MSIPADDSGDAGDTDHTVDADADTADTADTADMAGTHDTAGVQPAGVTGDARPRHWSDGLPPATTGAILRERLYGSIACLSTLLVVTEPSTAE